MEKDKLQLYLEQLQNERQKIRKELLVAVDMTDYKEKISEYSYEQLQKEIQIIRDKQVLNYYIVSRGDIEEKRLNIQNCPDEKARICARKTLAILNKFINDELNKFTKDFSLSWKYINDEFIKTTMCPDYVSDKPKKMTIPFADKLNSNGIRAYQKYLMIIDQALGFGNGLEKAVRIAIDVERDLDKELNREDFYTDFFLASAVNTIYKNLAKEKCISNRIKELGNVKKEEEIQTK